MNTVYIAGKISGDADYKQKFNDAQKNLEERGFAVMNPAWMPSEGFSYEAYIRIGKAMLKECSIFCLLPDWEESAGASNELQLAASLKKEIMYYSDIIAESNDNADAEVSDNTQDAHYYELEIRGNSEHLRRLFGQKYECITSANIPKPTRCYYIIKTETKLEDMDKYKAVNMLLSATNVCASITDGNDIAEACTKYFEIRSEDYVSSCGINIETAFMRRLVSPLGVFYTSS